MKNTPHLVRMICLHRPRRTRTPGSILRCR